MPLSRGGSIWTGQNAAQEGPLAQADCYGVQALLEAAKNGQDSKSLGLLPAPHHVETDGSIRVPPKWENTMKKAWESEAFKKQKMPPGTPPRTPPRSPHT